MVQNYKVFIKNTQLILTDVRILDESHVFIHSNEILNVENDLFSKVHDNVPVVYILCLDEPIDSVLSRVFIKFKKIAAAGGWVVSKQGTLFIKRNGYWDLPKGKVEKFESIEEAAIREVEEECGIHDLLLKNKIMNTYHCYEMKGKWYFKSNHWFLMEYHGNESLTPQLDEGITEVKWLMKDEISLAMAHTYDSLLDLIQTARKINL